VKSILKSLLAVLLGLGFLALDARAQGAPAEAPKKPAIAFLGLTEASDPQIGEDIGKRIRREIGADPELISVPGEKVAMLFAKGILRAPDARPDDPEALRREVGEPYFAYGSLERVSVTAKRTWWKPWSLKNTWTQGMRLHVVDGAKGEVVYDGLVAVAVPEQGFLFAPEGDWGRIPPLERDKRLRIMAEAVSVQTAKALAKAVKDRQAAPAAGDAAAPPG
jgi:hypothetical protein